MSNLRQYIAWCEQRIGRLIIAEGLRCGLLGVVQGPLTLTYQVRLLQPSPAALRRLLGLGPALAQALQCGAVRVAEQPGYIAIELPSPIQRTPSAQELLKHSRGLTVCVGLDALRRPAGVDLRQHGAIFWVGPSRRGKTQSMKATLYSLATRNGSRLKYVILSQKRQDWAAFAGAAGCMGLVSGAGEGLQALRWTAGLVSSGAKSGFTIVVVVDDLLNLLSVESGIAAPLAEIASMGAGLGVHLLAGTQEAGSKRGTGGAGVENNATAKVLYKAASAAAGARAAGQAEAGLEALSGAKGDALLLVDGEGKRIATGWADDREILQLPQDEGLSAPWSSRQPLTTSHSRLQLAYAPGALASAGAVAGAELQPVEPVAAVVNFPIPKRPPTEAEAAEIRTLARQGESLNALCRRVYGFKDGPTFAWIKATISESRAAELAENATQIDLTTAEGRQALEALQEAGLLRWQDVGSPAGKTDKT